MTRSPPTTEDSGTGAAILELALRPLESDPKDLGVENGVRIWGAYSCDPAFVASLPAGRSALQAGWYSAAATLDGRSGDIDEPRLYLPDAAGNYAERHSIRMIRKGADYTAEFFLPHAATELRFDPSRYPCEFGCNSLKVASIPNRRRGLAGRLGVFRPPVPGAGLALRWWRTGLRRLAAHTPASTRQMAGSTSTNRKKRVLATIDKNGVGIEIGPSHDPIAPKREGYKVHVIDHASREELLGKYKEHPIVLDQVEEVDFIWRGQSYVELTGKPRHYDWIIASHLIEHTPDLIAFLEDCDSILKDGGVLSLVVPDKRYCFDRFRPITGLARVLDSHFAGNKIHSAGAAAEYFMNVAGKDHKLAWDADTSGDYVFLHSAQYAREMIREVHEKGSYLDIHNWCFVPHSFRLLLADLYALGLTRLREVQFHPTEGMEFYVTLGRHGTGPDKSRLEILRAIDAEVAAVDQPSRPVAIWRLLVGR